MNMSLASNEGWFQQTHPISYIIDTFSNSRSSNRGEFVGRLCLAHETD